MVARHLRVATKSPECDDIRVVAVAVGVVLASAGDEPQHGSIDWAVDLASWKRVLRVPLDLGDGKDRCPPIRAPYVHALPWAKVSEVEKDAWLMGPRHVSRDDGGARGTRCRALLEPIGGSRVRRHFQVLRRVHPKWLDGRVHPQRWDRSDTGRDDFIGATCRTATSAGDWAAGGAGSWRKTAMTSSARPTPASHFANTAMWSVRRRQQRTRDGKSTRPPAPARARPSYANRSFDSRPAVPPASVASPSCRRRVRHVRFHQRSSHGISSPSRSRPLRSEGSRAVYGLRLTLGA